MSDDCGRARVALGAVITRHGYLGRAYTRLVSRQAARIYCAYGYIYYSKPQP